MIPRRVNLDQPETTEQAAFRQARQLASARVTRKPRSPLSAADAGDRFVAETQRLYGKPLHVEYAPESKSK